ncbi:hypothetical protein [Nonomuraea sp. NPDC048826]|uniref:hypothetical protein n=1 Tax=Nonomuraea sp. NPDC048826 TaxID=3364347 RepID=UPI0037166E30
MASDLALYPAMMDSYPHRHLFVSAGSVGATTALIFWCVEMLEAKGWTICHWQAEDWHVRGVVARRA